MKKLFSALILTLDYGRAAAKSFWSNLPADFGDIIREAYPIGNGRLAALPNGEPGAEALNFNLDSLWTGGPFESDSYAGGNPSEEVYSFLPGIREWIFQNATGNVSKLLHDYENYGSYSVLANLTITIANVTGSTGYMRSLDLTTGIHTTNYTGSDGNFYATTSYCSYPDQVCIYNLSCNSTLPDISIGFQNLLVDGTIQNLTCGDNYVRIAGNLQAGPPLGMRYDAIARLVSSGTISVCNGTENGTMIIPSSAGLQSFSIVIGAGSNYDQKKGNSASNYSFQGDDPGGFVELVTSAAAQKLESDLRCAHIEDYSSLTGSFSLDLPDTKGSSQWRTDLLISQYTVIDQDPYLESLMFEFGRHLFISSSRENSLPANLQGKWNYQSDPAWSADYHANINIQMNNWFADQLGLGNLTKGLWNYIEDTWVPRGSETAQLLYGAPGWVVHNEMNIFGHTGMKNGSQWADYPAAAAWLMQHLWDHYEYSGNETWFQIQGYPMIKGVAGFWLSQLQPDSYFNDGTLVVNPCNSPEHGVTTFGCTHFQQFIYQVFNYVNKAETFIPDSDTEFIARITTALQSLDKGLHIGTWNEIKEWKIPDTYGYDFQNDTHRHISNLYGWYPGYSISSYASGYTDPAIQSAIANTLYSRGIGGDVMNGQASQANAGWQKVWRAACWARLNNTERAYFELRFTIMSNFVENGLSMYSGHDEPFQIDANFGYVGAVLSMLVVDLSSLEDDKRTVVLGPAIPAAWAGGSVRGLRLRGGGVVSFSWDDDGVVDSILDVQNTKGVTLVNAKGEMLYDSLE